MGRGSQVAHAVTRPLTPHTHLVLLAATLLPVVEDVVPCVIFGQQQWLLCHLPPPYEEQQQQQDDWGGRVPSAGTCVPHCAQGRGIPTAPGAPLTQQGQQRAQGGKDEGQGGDRLRSLGTALCQPLAGTDPCSDNGHLGSARLVQQPQVHAVRVRLQRCHQLQCHCVTYVRLGGHR